MFSNLSNEMVFTRTFYGNQDAKTEIKFSHQDSLARSHYDESRNGKRYPIENLNNFCHFSIKTALRTYEPASL